MIIDLSGGLATLTELSDSLLTDVCTISSIAKVENSTGGETLVPTDYSDIPCRLDCLTDSQIAQDETSGIVGDKVTRTLYISTAKLVELGFYPKASDIITTAASNPLGLEVSYTISKVNNETDEIDFSCLLEKIEDEVQTEEE